MKKAYRYLTFAVIAALGVACSKNPVADETGTGDYMISFGKVATKAASDPVADPDKKLQIKVYDYFTKAGETAESEYFNDIIQEAKTSTADAPVWAFLGGSHAWKAGSHEFIGWVSTDEQGEASGFSYADKALTLAEAELPGEKNLDYRYAADTTVSWVKADKDKTVELKVKHLSSALTYTLNDDNAPANKSFKIKSVTVGNVVTKAAAAVTYEGDGEPAVAFTPNTTKGNVALLADTETCVWPQTIDGTTATLTVVYDESTTTGEGEEAQTTTAEKTATIKLPATTWESGKVYNYDIVVVDKSIELVLHVADWTDKTGSVTYGTGNIVTAVALEYTSGAAITTGGGRRRNNYFATANDPIVAYFSVYAPTDGQWKIKITGDTSVLVVTSEDGEKTTFTEGEGDDAVSGEQIIGDIGGEDGKTGRVTFQIERGASATATSTIQLNFLVVTADGREISMNSEVTRRNALTITGKIGQ